MVLVRHLVCMYIYAWNYLWFGCRHPIPDHYSLTLEISRDRITAAHPYTCDSKDATKEDCPPGYNDGDLFLYRTLNEPCQKMVSEATHRGSGVATHTGPVPLTTLTTSFGLTPPCLPTQGQSL